MVTELYFFGVNNPFNAVLFCLQANLTSVAYEVTHKVSETVMMCDSSLWSCKLRNVSTRKIRMDDFPEGLQTLADIQAVYFCCKMKISINVDQRLFGRQSCLTLSACLSKQSKYVQHCQIWGETRPSLVHSYVKTTSQFWEAISELKHWCSQLPLTM